MLRVLVLLVLAAVALGAGCGGDEEATPGEGCEDVEAPDERSAGPHALPSRGIDFQKTWQLVFRHATGISSGRLEEIVGERAGFDVHDPAGALKEDGADAGDGAADTAAGLDGAPRHNAVPHQY